MPRRRFWQSGGMKWGMWNTPNFTFSSRFLRLSSSNGRAPWRYEGGQRKVGAVKLKNQTSKQDRLKEIILGNGKNWANSTTKNPNLSWKQFCPQHWCWITNKEQKDGAGDFLIMAQRSCLSQSLSILASHHSSQRADTSQMRPFDEWQPPPGGEFGERLEKGFWKGERYRKREWGCCVTDDVSSV